MTFLNMVGSPYVATNQVADPGFQKGGAHL